MRVRKKWPLGEEGVWRRGHSESSQASIAYFGSAIGGSVSASGGLDLAG